MTLGPVRVMGAGVVVMMCVEEVCRVGIIIIYHSHGFSLGHYFEMVF